MKRKSSLKAVLFMAVALALLTGIAFSEPMDIPEDARCHLCGMKVDPTSEFSAQIVIDGELLSFCDIGDMLYHYNKQDEKPTELYVRDSKGHGWIDATKATFVKSEDFDTPMGWGIAAFADSDDCAVKYDTFMTFEEALASLGTGMKKGKMRGKM